LASKSTISALIGMLIENGRLALDDLVVERLQVRGLEPGRDNITVRDLLIIASGLESTSREAYNVLRG
jgi:CubicO group peptidase (beta-lactamase class C family)